MVKRRAKKKRIEIATERIHVLWKEAKKYAISRPELAREWVNTARKIAAKARIKLPQEIGQRICKNCGSVYVYGRNCQVRIRHNRTKHMTITCKNCGAIKRILVTRQA
ncbi:MAG: ribonuclease P protein component 4 [Candidatus Lokiarchaeota archaeon]|nr:ribonuclease P protein component 4 [Candidatus Lokiarchaeota archaeon]